MIQRRQFLRTSLLSGAYVQMMAGIGSWALPFARAAGANQDIRLGVIGVGSTVKIGGMGKKQIRAFRQIPGVRVVAICDPDRAHLDAEAEQFKKWNAPLETYTDLRKMLDNKNIDAVVITTPNHWHALATIWACQAGKDVFVQKPACHNIFEGRKMIEASRKYNQVVHCPSMSRSPNGIKEALDYMRQGNLGKPLYVHGINYKPRTSIGKVSGQQPVPSSLDYNLWSGPAPVLPVMREYLHYDWHWMWQYGNGDLGNMGIHALDGCRMAVNHDSLPPRVLSIGGRFGYTDDGQTPNTQIMWFDYQPVPIVFEVRGLPKNKSFLKSAWDRNVKATMDSHFDIQVGLTVHCEQGYIANNKAFDSGGKLIKEFKPTIPEPESDFIAAVQQRKTSGCLCDIPHGHWSAALIHMCNASYRLGKASLAGETRERIQGNKQLQLVFERFQEHLLANDIDLVKEPSTLGPVLTMNPNTEHFVGDFSNEANLLITREYRAPFVVPEKV